MSFISRPSKSILKTSFASTSPSPSHSKLIIQQQHRQQLGLRKRVRFDENVYVYALPDSHADLAWLSRFGTWLAAPFHDELWDGYTQDFRKRPITKKELKKINREWKWRRRLPTVAFTLLFEKKFRGRFKLANSKDDIALHNERREKKLANAHADGANPKNAKTGKKKNKLLNIPLSPDHAESKESDLIASESPDNFRLDSSASKDSKDVKLVDFQLDFTDKAVDSEDKNINNNKGVDGGKGVGKPKRFSYERNLQQTPTHIIEQNDKLIDQKKIVLDAYEKEAKLQRKLSKQSKDKEERLSKLSKLSREVPKEVSYLESMQSFGEYVYSYFFYNENDPNEDEADSDDKDRSGSKDEDDELEFEEVNSLNPHDTIMNALRSLSFTHEEGEAEKALQEMNANKSENKGSFSSFLGFFQSFGLSGSSSEDSGDKEVSKEAAEKEL